MLHLSDKHREIIRVCAWIAFIILFIYLFTTRIIVFLGPFLVALIIVLIIQKPVDAIQKTYKIKRGIATIAVLLVFVAVFGGGLGFLIYRLIAESLAFAQSIITGGELELYLDSFFNRLRTLHSGLPAETAQAVEDTISSFAQNTTNQAIAALENVLNFLLNFPRIIIFIVISLVAAFFMCKDRERILAFTSKQIPDIWQQKIISVFKELIRTILVYVKAQAITSSFTFILLLTGYTLLGLEYVVIFALFTTLFDALPVLGAGMVLGTSAVIQLVMGDIIRSAGFIVIYFGVLTVRNTVEPKVIGKGVGIHPLLILLSMYTGLQLIGAIGLILGPIFVITMRALQKVGILPEWKR